MAVMGTPWVTASRTVQRPSPESSTQPLMFFKSLPSCSNARSASSSSHDRTTLPWSHTVETFRRSRSNSLACRSSNPSPYACIIPYSIPLWTIFTKCPAPFFPKCAHPFGGASVSSADDPTAELPSPMSLVIRTQLEQENDCEEYLETMTPHPPR